MFTSKGYFEEKKCTQIRRKKFFSLIKNNYTILSCVEISEVRQLTNTQCIYTYLACFIILIKFINNLR